jgi:hypothetical protein
VSADSYAWVQEALTNGQTVPDGEGASWHLVQRDGVVALVRLARNGAGIELADFQLFTIAQAARSSLVRRVRAALSPARAPRSMSRLTCSAGQR